MSNFAIRKETTMKNKNEIKNVFTNQPISPLAKELKYFYVFGNYFAGHVELYEEVKTRISFSDKEDFINKISIFIDLEPTTPEILQNSQYQTIFTPIPLWIFPEFMSPSIPTSIKNCPIVGTFCFINVGDGFFDISLHGDGQDDRFGINEAAIRAALAIEEIIEKNQLTPAINHSISEDFNCIQLK